MHEMQHPHKKLRSNNAPKEGANAVNNNSHINITEDNIKEVRRPNLSEINPHTGAVTVMAKNTDVVKAKVPLSETFQVLHSKAGANIESIMISIASVKKTHPEARESII